MGSPTLALAAWIGTLWWHRRTGEVWLVPVLIALALVFGWRLAHHLHLWQVLEYGGAHAAPEETARARKRYKVAAFIYSGFAVIVTFWFVDLLMDSRGLSASLTLLLGAFLIVANWAAFYHNYILKGKYVSQTPLLGGLLASIGLALFPLADLRAYAWVPFVVDVGCVPTLLHVVWFFGTGRHKRR
jgi:hypothetical protein